MGIAASISLVAIFLIALKPSYNPPIVNPQQSDVVTALTAIGTDVPKKTTFINYNHNPSSTDNSVPELLPNETTTTTDPLIYADNYTYTYISTLSNGEETTETVTGKAIIGYAGASRASIVEIQTLDIPDDVVIIADNAFQFCIIHNLDLKNVQVIGQSAFSGGSDFTAVYLPANLCYIGAQAFFSTDTVRTFYLNQGWDIFLDRVCFGMPDPFGRSDKVVFCKTDGTGDYEIGECTENILEWINAIMHGTAEPNS